MLVEILRCETCHLWFRWPADTAQDHQEYYEEEYASDSPQVALPNEKDLLALKGANFVGSPLDMSDRIGILRELCPGCQVLDFGCSWGYGTYQLQQQGFAGVGFEISKRRAEYGRANLGLKIIDSYQELAELPAETFDCVFSNHVVEHLPNIAQAFSLFTQLLKRNGFVFHVLPNFTGEKARSGDWLKWIGEDHPIAPAIPFFRISIVRAGLGEPVFASSPFDSQLSKALTGSAAATPSTEGDELLVYARKV